MLLVAFSSQGHMNPMLHLAELLAARGVRPTLATTEVARHRMLKSANLSADRMELEGGIRLAFFSDGLPLDFDRRSNLGEFFVGLNRCGPANLSRLIAECPARFSCIVTTPFLPWVADVAEEHGIPCALLWIQPCSLFILYRHYFTDPAQFQRVLHQEDSDAPAAALPEQTLRLPGLPVMTKDDLPTFVIPSKSEDYITRIILEVFRDDMAKIRWVLVNSFYEMERDAVDSLATESFRVIPIGPLIPPALLAKEHVNEQAAYGGGFDMFKADDSCLEWLDGKPAKSVVYVSFGSVTPLTPSQMEQVAQGLSDCDRPYLWVVRPAANAGNQLTQSLPDVLVRDMKKNKAMVVPWCPQGKVLQHRAVGCFLTHCGWNSSLETVTSGMPVVAFPLWSDQPTNAKLLADILGVGVKTQRGEGTVSSQEVRRCVEVVMDGSELATRIRSCAAEWSKAAKAAVAAGGSSDKAIAMFVEEMTGGPFSQGSLA